MDMTKYWVWLSHVNGVGPRQAAMLIERFETPKAVFERAMTDELEPMKPLWRDRLINAASGSRIDDIMDRLAKRGIRAVTPGDGEYPPLLLEIYDPPIVLYCKGSARIARQNTVAIIGTRNPSRYGLECARHFGRELAGQGLCVVSGLARGIDTEAHIGALESDKEAPTMAVLGCGVDIPYPSSSARIYARIVERGVVMSEFIPGTSAAPGNFPQRNRIISGLSLGTLVIEAGERSGTSITVNAALDQGREVLAVPGRITDQTSEGTNNMIKAYAHVATCAQDVLGALGLSAVPAYVQPDESELSETEAAIVKQLQTGEKSADELVEMAKISISALNSSLTSLEFRGIIRQLPGRLFALPMK